ncbi:MAG TPA: tRNA (adenosine(37)-N6)-threonylcarbamoyltransferase complex dimerization subunit type 1 TsaB [Gemmatimonadota bacterium]|jgi:tRNA threonylcarbamoyladenosine biosynthesis protein TsaB
MSGPRVVLAIDTATAAGTVALRVADRTRERRLEWRASFRQIAPAVEGLMNEAGVDWRGLEAIAVPSGPGSFTGLRVGAALALGIARIAGRPLLGVPTLVAVAEAFARPDERLVCATLDARRGRRYAALCERSASGLWDVLAGPLDATPAEVAGLAGEIRVVSPELALTHEPAGLAAALARLAAADPDRYRSAGDGIELVYARAGIDPV